MTALYKAAADGDTNALGQRGQCDPTKKVSRIKSDLSRRNASIGDDGEARRLVPTFTGNSSTGPSVDPRDRLDRRHRFLGREVFS